MSRTSICIATHNKPAHLQRVLESIFVQKPSFEFEVIVVDDGPSDDQSQKVCGEFPVRYVCITRPPSYRNPSAARNVAYRLAKGDVVICQSDDVVHAQNDCIERLTLDLKFGEFLIATVSNINWDGSVCPKPLPVFTSPSVRRPLFFLGSLWRRDLYAVGGNDAEFVAPAFDDDWFADCLIHGRKLTPRYVTVVGNHIDHSRPTDLPQIVDPSWRLYNAKVAAARQDPSKWIASGGAWPFVCSLTDWWNECHYNSDKRWLTGSLATGVLDLLSIAPQRGQVVLDIGVGTGEMAKELQSRKVTVDCLDISLVALDRVRKHCRACYSQSSDLPSGEYHLAIAHLVAQHVDDKTLTTEVRDVLRALKPAGMLAIQFADSPQPRSQSLDAQKRGGVCRSPEEACALVQEAGGIVLRQSDIMRFNHTAATWFSLLVGRPQ